MGTSRCSTTRSGSTGRVKLGQPVPESNLSRELKRGSPLAMSTYSPASWLSQKRLRKGGSVAAFCVTSYSRRDRRFRSSVSEGFSYVVSITSWLLSAGPADRPIVPPHTRSAGGPAMFPA